MRRVEAGEEVLIARAGKPAVRLVALERPPPKRHFGRLKGQISVDERFFEALGDAELTVWE
jgi:antitoxin (DNA-binding transcriptional repressor) of toxin-antitoxin stability system